MSVLADRLATKVFLGKEDLPKSAIAPVDDVGSSWARRLSDDGYISNISYADCRDAFRD